MMTMRKRMVVMMGDDGDDDSKDDGDDDGENDSDYDGEDDSDDAGGLCCLVQPRPWH